MKTFVLFCCTVISGVGFVSGGRVEVVEAEEWKGIAKVLDWTNTELETDQDKISAAGSYFEWFIKRREGKLSAEELARAAPVITCQKMHAMFTSRVENPKNTAVVDYFQVFITENGAHPSETEVNGMTDYVYIDTEQKSNVTQIKKDILTAIMAFKNNNPTVFPQAPEKVIIHYKYETIGPNDNADHQELRICIQLVVTE